MHSGHTVRRLPQRSKTLPYLSLHRWSRAARRRLNSDPKLKKSAQQDGQQIFEKNVFPKIFGETAQTSYMEDYQAYQSMFNDAAKYRAIMAAMAEVLYNDLRKE